MVSPVKMLGQNQDAYVSRLSALSTLDGQPQEAQDAHAFDVDPLAETDEHLADELELPAFLDRRARRASPASRNIDFDNQSIADDRRFERNCKVTNAAPRLFAKHSGA